MSGPGIWVSTLSTEAFLDVERAAPTPSAYGVGLILSLSKAGCTFGLNQKRM